MQYLGRGLAGIQGIFYVGTNCLHRRQVIYGLSPDHHIRNGKKHDDITDGTLISLLSFITLLYSF